MFAPKGMAFPLPTHIFVAMIVRLSLLLCLLTGPFFARAQAQAAGTDKPFARWYAGLQYGPQNFQLFIPGEPQIGRTETRRPQLTAGYQLTPRFAVQLGLAPVAESFASSSAGTNLAGQPVREEGWSSGKSLAVPLTGRYTLGFVSWKQLHMDVLAGGVLFWTDSQTNFRRVENGVTTTDYHREDRFTQFYGALGPSLRYDFGARQQVGVFADLLYYKNARSTSPGNQIMSTGNKNGITHSITYGVRYRFAYR